MMTPRRASVRTSSGTPPRAATRMPAVCGDSGAPSRIALRSHGDHQSHGHPGLGQDRPDGRPGDAEAGAVDQSDVENDVGAEPRDGDHERGPGVLQPAQQPGCAEDHEHCGEADGGDAQVDRGLLLHARRPADGGAEARRGDRQHDRRQRPSPTDSQSPSTPAATASVTSPAPSRRATTLVVPYARNTNTPTAVRRIDEATPRAASDSVPRWPTIAESARRNRGSATRVRKAGIARRRISRLIAAPPARA